MTIELYIFEDRDGTPDDWTTYDSTEAREYAMRYNKRWIARSIFEYSDEVVEDYTHPDDDDPEDDSTEDDSEEWIEVAPVSTFDRWFPQHKEERQQ